MRCPHCGKGIDESLFPPPLTYCPYCGQNLEASSTERVTEEILFCPHCGKELPGTVSFCPYCGEEVAKRITTQYDRGEESERTEREAKPIIEPLPGQRKTRGKLYKQWVKHADLYAEAAPSMETPKDTPVGRDKKVQRLPVLYTLLGFGIIIFFVGVAFAIMQSC